MSTLHITLSIAIDKSNTKGKLDNVLQLVHNYITYLQHHTEIIKGGESNYYQVKVMTQFLQDHIF